MHLHEPSLFLPAGAVEIASGLPWLQAEALAKTASRVDIRFETFRDGRGFSLAALLRQRAGFAGELRAVGPLLPDQALHLMRSGFDGVEAADPARKADWRCALARFSVVYQPAADARAPAHRLRLQAGIDARLAELNARWRGQSAEAILREALVEFPRGRVAYLSSFGAEAAAGLHVAARVDPALPVLFLDTGRHFGETLSYREALTARLDLRDVRVLRPDATEIKAEDADDDLWRRDADACCALRKVRPLERILVGFDAVITGRKRFHGGERLRLPVAEHFGGVYRINLLADWTEAAVAAYFAAHDLPRHGLTGIGYRSIGCWPCTQATPTGAGARVGRWAGRSKTECGIHAPAAQQPRRAG